MDTTQTALRHPRQPAFFTVERLSREVFFPHRQDIREKALVIQSCCASFCLITLHAQLTFFRASSIALALYHLHVATEDSLCFASRQSRAFQHLSLPAHSLVMHVAAPHHSLTRSRKPCLDRLPALGLVGGTVPATPRDFFPLVLEIRHCISLLFVHEQAGCHAAVPERTGVLRFRATFGFEKLVESCSLDGFR